MKLKTVVVFLSLLAVVVIGYNLGKESLIADNKKKSVDVESNQEDTKATNEKEIIPLKLPSREVANTPVDLSNEKQIYRENLYWQQAIEDPRVVDLYKKTYEKFKNSSQAEDIAVWIALSLIFDSSPAYGVLLTAALNEINHNKEENFGIIRDVISKMPPEESFLRGMTLNLAYNINIARDEKISFFGSEIVRPVKLDSYGKFTPDSLNITTAMIFLKDNIRDPSDAKFYILKSLDNNKDPKAKKQLLVRLKAYFPEHSEELKD